jgi:hypothetical protein
MVVGIIELPDASISETVDEWQDLPVISPPRPGTIFQEGMVISTDQS